VGDLRESPALKLVELLRDEGAEVSYHDPHVPELPAHGLASQALETEADCVAIVTAHSGIDYERLAERASLIVDFRNATGANGSANGRVWKL
jgi:UDP-N-acetyl-D-glucosamine dehydrogenase